MSISADCHFGDHRYAGAVCSDCGRFDAALLSWLRFEKAEREGRDHGDHFHKTLDAKARCRRPEWREEPEQ